jgi:hypothetical protein
MEETRLPVKRKGPAFSATCPFFFVPTGAAAGLPEAKNCHKLL